MMKVKIIAEAGVNHNGDMMLAYKLVDAAKDSGANIIKFQTFNPKSIVSKFAQKAEYQKRNTGGEDGQLTMLNKLALSQENFVDLKAYCEKVGIDFLSTPFDLESIEFLDSIGCRLWKIPSGEITNYPYLVKIAKTGYPVIMSTGMSNMEEIGEALDVLTKNGSGEISLLHCTTEYPAPFEDVNLKAMHTLKEKFGCKIGYSDHTKGIEIPIAAVAMGAEIIEKHFTLDKNMEGPDHKASLEPNELKAMVQAIRNVEKAIGDGNKTPSNSEKKNIEIVRKSIVAKRNIKTGERLTEENITTKRPGNGISPMRWNEVLGTVAKRDFSEDELIEV